MEILVREYLDCEYQILAMDEMERFCDVDGSSMNRNKTAKQLLGVAKQFGSIGKSMSKKFWLITKRPKSPPTSSSSSSSPAGLNGDGVLCVKVKITRHGLMNQMVQNYLDCAQER